MNAVEEQILEAMRGKEAIQALLRDMGQSARPVKSTDFSPIDPESGGCVHWLYDLGLELPSDYPGGPRWLVPGYDDGSIRPYVLLFHADSGCNIVTIAEWSESKTSELLGLLLARREFPGFGD